MPRLLQLLVLMSMAALVVSCGPRTSSRPPQSSLVGKPAPSVNLELLGGGDLDLAKHKGKDIVILDFWATWCGPCVAAMPVVEQVAAEYRSRGVVLYAVNQREDARTIRSFLKDQGINVNVALDSNGSVGDTYGVQGIPTMVIIDKGGVVRDVHIGFNPDLENELREQLDAILASPGSAESETAQLEDGRSPFERERSQLVGQAAPAVNLKLLNGNDFDLADHAGKEVVILDFWATWCGPCVAAMPILEQVAEEYKSKGVVLYSVNQQEDAKTIRDFLDEEGLKVNVALDSDGEVGEAYGVEGIPTMVIIDKQGIVRDVHVGLSPGLENELHKQLDEVLKNPSSSKPDETQPQ